MDADMEKEKNKRKSESRNDLNVMTCDDAVNPGFPDTEGIGYNAFIGGSTIGYIESINGPQSEACRQFQPTQYEMKIIAKFWYRELTDIDLFWFQTKRLEAPNGERPFTRSVGYNGSTP